jgi:hypothetical protein
VPIVAISRSSLQARKDVTSTPTRAKDFNYWDRRELGIILMKILSVRPDN